MDFNINLNIRIDDDSLRMALKAYAASTLNQFGAKMAAELSKPQQETAAKTEAPKAEAPKAEEKAAEEKPPAKKKKATNKKTPVAEKEQAPIEDAVEETVAPAETPEPTESNLTDDGLAELKEKTVAALRSIAAEKGMNTAQALLKEMGAESITQLLSKDSLPEVEKAANDFISRCELELAS